MKFFHNQTQNIFKLVQSGQINILVLDGEEGGKIKSIANSFEDFCKSVHSDIEVLRFNMDELGDSRVIDVELSTQSMFASKKLVYFFNLKAGDFDSINNFNGKSEDACLGIFCFNESLKSKAKKLEDSPNIAIITCYSDTEQDLQTIALNQFKHNGYTCSGEALSFISASCKGNRMNMMMEIDKLMTYKIDEKSIELDDARQLISDGVEQNVFAQSDYLLIMKPEETIKILSRLEAANESFASLLPFVKRDALFLKNLLLSARNNEVSAEDELKKECQKNKFLFIKMPILKQQLNYWTLKKIDVFLKELQEVEISSRQHAKFTKELITNLFLKFCLYK
jgi:DNA polymerase III delta subunit